MYDGCMLPAIPIFNILLSRLFNTLSEYTVEKVTPGRTMLRREEDSERRRVGCGGVTRLAIDYNCP